MENEFHRVSIDRLQGHEWVVFVDESKSNSRCRWTYIGVTLVRARDLEDVAGRLIDARNLIGCGSEIHFSNLNNHQPVELAKSWIEIGNNDSRIKQVVRGIEIGKLNSKNFASNKEDSVLARFSRSAIIFGLQKFGGDSPVVGAIFYDQGNLATDIWFSTSIVKKIRAIQGITVIPDSVEFIDSNHKSETSNPILSNMIQFTDLTIGISRQCMEMSSMKPQRIEVSQLILPTIENKTIGNSQKSGSTTRTINSTFDISFFPSPGGTVTAEGGRFYSRRVPAMSSTNPNSTSSVSIFNQNSNMSNRK